MRYFLLSLVINLIILFLPLQSSEAVKTNNDHKIIINLREYEIKKEINQQKVDNNIVKDLKELKQDKVSFVKNIQKKQKKYSKKEIIKNIKKESKVTKIKNKENNTKSIENVSKSSMVTNKSNILNTSNSLSQISDNKAQSDESICSEGVGFVILNDLKPEYPKKALMLRLRDTFRVEVEFKIDENGNIDILNVNGKNSIFNDAAKKLVKNLNIKILKPGISKCKIIKPYEFVFER